MECTYKIYEEIQRAQTLHIIDVLPLTPDSFEEAIKQVYKATAACVDLIIYVGKLPFKPRRLIRLPKSMEPQKIKMTGRILKPEIVDRSVFAIENWNVNVSNFDVR